jgi:xanthine dehydrogenase accessory protein pucB
MDDSRLIGIYLAAGKSSRMGRHKLNLPIGDMLLGGRALKEAIESKLNFIIVVTRKGYSQKWLTPFINNKKWKMVEVEGDNQSDSLKAGLKEGEERGADAVLVLLADQPFVTKGMINQLIDRFEDNTFVSFSKNGKGMPPALFSKILFKNLYSLEGDQGARAILRGEARKLGRLIEIDDDLAFLDIDTQEDYQRIPESLIKNCRIRRGNMDVIGKSVIRKESLEKVTGSAMYTDDYKSDKMLSCEMVISPYAHAKIVSIETTEAWKIPGVRAIVAGERFPLIGEAIRDRPPIAVDKVRYHGEPVALVVAETPVQAKKAADQIKVQYELLPVVNSPTQAFQKNAPLVHENLKEYKKDKESLPVPDSNIATHIKIRKGNMEKGWAESEVTVEASYSFAPSDHAAMETRCSIAEILPDGVIKITTSSQAPFMVKRLISDYFGEDIGKIVVHTPLVGGAYGGKASTQLEVLAYLASKAAGGRPVKLLNTREEDMITSPCHIGLDAMIKFGADRSGKIKAAEIRFLWDGGAYSDKAIDLTRAGATDCTGPYNIENVWCDSYCMYTNHTYPAPYRGFSHSELSFAGERTMDLLAKKINMDPLEIRYVNAIMPGNTTPTQFLLNKSTVGNLRKCITRIKELMHWDEGAIHEIDERFVRVKGYSCSWKNSTIDTNAPSGVILTFNHDGSINLMSGVIEIGTGTKTVLAQILAERLKMDVDKIHVRMEVDTQTTPEHWKTVASRGTYMAGRATLEAADDVINQLKEIAACVLRAAKEELEIANSRVFLREDPSVGLHFKDIAYGYTYPNGNAIGGQIIGRGNFILHHLTYLNPETGEGRPGPEWTVAAYGVEVEFDRRDYTYRLLKAATVVDIGKVLNQKAALGQVMGAMSMGLAFAGRETFYYDELGRVLNPQLRTYRPLRYGENPEYLVDFVETPHLDAPYGARGVGEHGLMGMPGALANALSLAAGVSLHNLPLIPELIWKAKEAEQ